MLWSESGSGFKSSRPFVDWLTAGMDLRDEMMDANEGIEDDEDDGEEGDDEEEEEDDVGEEFIMSLEPERTNLAPKTFEDEEYQHEVLTADQIVQHMVDCIKEVNTVVQVTKLWRFWNFSF